MKKIIFLVVAVISLSACNFFSEKTEKNGPVAATELSPCENEVNNLKSLLKARDNEITELRIDTAELSAQIRCFKALNDCGCSEVKKAPAKKSPAKSTYRKSSKPIAREEIVEPEITETRIVKNISTGTPNLSYLRDENGKIIFCCPANGREKDLNFPHYAMQQGFTFSNFKDNSVNGYNWDVEPSDGYTGDYGITKQGTFYVSKPLVVKALQKGGIQFEYLTIKCAYTKWIPKRMDEEGTFLVYRTQK